MEALLESIMSYLRAAGGATRHFCLFLFSIAVFLLWASLAAGAGFILLHLPDVWAMHSNETSSRYAVMSVTAYALIIGVLFLMFTAGSIERLFDALIVARRAYRYLRETRAIRRMHGGPTSAITLHSARHS
jgi:hypothetical protein